MTLIIHNFKIFDIIIKSIAINVVDYFPFFKRVAKMLFHNPSVLIEPLASRKDFNYDIVDTLSINNSFGKKWDCFGMIHPTHCNTNTPFPFFWISGNMKTFFTLARVIVGIAICPFGRDHRLATNATWFF